MSEGVFLELLSHADLSGCYYFRSDNDFMPIVLSWHVTYGNRIMRGILLFSTIIVLVSSSALAVEPPKPEVQIRYSSPEEVFKVYREATQKNDWRTIWTCLSPTAQKSAIFECFFVSELKPRTHKIHEVMKKYGADPDKLDSEYRDEYQKKHRVELKKDAPTPDDSELVQEMTFNQIVDKPGFFVSIHTVLSENRVPEKIGELKRVDIQNNLAQVHTTTTLNGLATEPNQPTKKFEQIVPKVIHLSKTPKGWLIE